MSRQADVEKDRHTEGKLRYNIDICIEKNIHASKPKGTDRYADAGTRMHLRLTNVIYWVIYLLLKKYIKTLERKEK